MKIKDLQQLIGHTVSLDHPCEEKPVLCEIENAWLDVSDTFPYEAEVVLTLAPIYEKEVGKECLDDMKSGNIILSDIQFTDILVTEEEIEKEINK